MSTDLIRKLRSKLITLEKDSTFKWSQFNQEAENALKQTADLKRYLTLTVEEPNRQIRPASVLISLVEDQNKQWHIVLTQRAKHLKNHAGEICFPGGRYEELDITLQQTAIRETEEEIGLKVQRSSIIGRLPRQITISQYYVTPYVAVYPSSPMLELSELKLDKNEVEKVFMVPLDFLLDKKNHQLKQRTVNNLSFSYYSIEYAGFNIWGATAQMLVNFSQLLK